MFARRLLRTILAVAICNGLCFELYAEPLEGLPESKGTTKSEEPPAPGPELLKYTPEQIEAAYEGKEMPEAVAMYLVIAKGGQLGGSGSWFAPAERRFYRALLAERNGMDADQSPPTNPAPAVAP